MPGIVKKFVPSHFTHENMKDELTHIELVRALKNLKMGTDYALSYLNIMKEKGRESIPIFELTYFSFNPIEDGKEKLNLLREKSQLKEVANKSDFARLMNISRTTVYNWDDIGLLIHTNDGKKIDLIKTLRLWEILLHSDFTLFK